jgi:hypothetical protein
MESIDLDCPPGSPRPWELIEGVVAGTLAEPMLTDDDKEAHAFFGAQTWYFDIPRETWVSEVQPVIKPRIEALYHNGTIRYGSW